MGRCGGAPLSAFVRVVRGFKMGRCGGAPLSASFAVCYTKSDPMIGNYLKKQKNKLIIFCYHSVSDNYNPLESTAQTKTSVFIKEISQLTKRFNIVPLYDTLVKLEAGEPIGECVALTFDDGDISVKTHIAPILERFQCPATFFINSCHLEHSQKLPAGRVLRYLQHSQDAELRNLTTNFPRNILKQLLTTKDPIFYNEKRKQIEDLAIHIPNTQQFFLSMDDLLALNPNLFHIGLHGHEHLRFSMMDYSWQHSAIKKNMDILQQLDNFRPIFAIPYGNTTDYNQDTIQICTKYGIQMLSIHIPERITRLERLTDRGLKKIRLKRLMPTLYPIKKGASSQKSIVYDRTTYKEATKYGL